MTPAELSRLSTLLDQALDLPEPERDAWLAMLDGEAAALAPALRELLARQASKETDSLLDRGPAFTAPGEPAAAAAFQAGDAVGPYRLLRPIGQGGMGEVWLAERSDGQLKRPVALKLPLLGLRRSVLVQRFARERDILGELAHPHIARLYDAGLADDGQPYLALEYVEGRTVIEHAAARQLAPAERVRLLLQVMDAVRYAHAHLVIHRDLKPSNVLVTDDGQAMLLDFGIAKLLQPDAAAAEATELTQLGGRALTLEYAAPEQISGAPVSTATDVHALGVLLYELLSGQRPFRGSRLELERDILALEPPRPPGVPTDLATIVLKAMKKAPAERYATVDAMAQDLERWLRGDAVLAQPDSAAYRLRKFVQRHRAGVAAAALASVALVVGASVAVWQAAEARTQARKAQEEARYADAVQDFLSGLFKANASRQKDPAKARATTARELLDLGAEQIATSLKDLPEARVQVLSTLSEMYYQLELDDKAAALDQEQVDVLRAMLGRDHPRVAGALIRLAGALHATGRRDEIIPALEEARRILDLQGPGHAAQRSDLLVRLAQRHFNVSLAKAQAYAAQAVAVIRAEPVVDHDMLSTALILGARARTATGDFSEAAALYRQAIDEALLVPERPHFDLMQARVSLAEVLAQQLKTEAALQLARDGIAAGAAALGDQAPGVLSARSRLATMLHAAGRRDEARELHRQVLEATLRIKGADDTMHTPIARIDMARSLLAEGRLAEAQALVEAVVPVYRRHYAGSFILGNALRTQAVVLGQRGRTDEAQALLDEARATWERGAGGALRPWRFTRLLLDKARAEVLAGRGDAALQTLQGFVAWPEGEIAAPRPEDAERDVLLALAQLQKGDTAAALRSARAAVATAVPVSAGGRLAGLEAEAQLALGWALLAAGEAGQAAAPLERAVALRRTFDAPASPWRAQAEAVRGLARLAQGDRAEARQAALRAQAIVAAYPSLGLQFTQPLDELQRALKR